MKYLKVFVDFAESLEPLGDAEIGRLFVGMLRYASDGTVPDFRGNERFVWPIAKKNIDASVKAYENLAANAKIARESLSKARASYSYDGLRLDKDKEKDKEKDNMSPPISPPGGKAPAKKQEPEPDYFAELPEDLRKKADDWLAYKRGRRFTYQPSGKRALASQMAKYAGQYGASAVCDAIDQAIASGYQGIVWDAIGRTKGSKPHGRQTRAHNHHQRTYTGAELAKIGVDLLEGG